MQSFVKLVTILMFIAGSLSGCASLTDLSESGVDMAQIPITEKPSGKRYPGKFIWHDLITPDALSAAKFYQQLFGWQIEQHGDYVIIRNGGKAIAGILQVKPAAGETKEGVWIASVSVADVDATASLVIANGGTISKGPLDMAGRGRAVMISDPQRADLVLLQAKDGDPIDTDVQIGDWLWDEIWTDNPDTTRKFYLEILGYDDVLSGNDYDVFVHEGQWRAGIRHLQNPKHMLWVPVVRVADPYAITRRVKELDGVVWVTPDEAPRKGEIALIADVTGALLLVQKWTPQVVEGGE